MRWRRRLLRRQRRSIEERNRFVARAWRLMKNVYGEKLERLLFADTPSPFFVTRSSVHQSALAMRERMDIAAEKQGGFYGIDHFVDSGPTFRESLGATKPIGWRQVIYDARKADK